MSGDVEKWKLLGARSHFDAAESHMKWDDLTDLGRQHVMKAFDDQLRAFLRAAASDGYRLVRVPDATAPNVVPFLYPDWNDVVANVGEEISNGFADGFNQARAQTIASAVEVGE